MKKLLVITVCAVGGLLLLGSTAGAQTTHDVTPTQSTIDLTGVAPDAIPAGSVNIVGYAD